MGHNGTAPVDVQFFATATPARTFIPLGPDLQVTPGMHTYTVLLNGLNSDQQTFIRGIGLNTRNHASQGNLKWTINEVRSVGTPLSSRVIADHDGGATDFDGAICSFDCAAIAGGDGGKNNSGMSVAGGALHWTDLGGSAGARVAWGNGTQSAANSQDVRPIDLSNYNFVTVRMAATGTDSSVGVDFFMYTGPGFTQKNVTSALSVDGAFHDLVFPLSTFTDRVNSDGGGIDLFTHASDLAIAVDSIVYSQQAPEPGALALLGLTILTLARRKRTRGP
jgi:hypothetical protein